MINKKTLKKKHLTLYNTGSYMFLFVSDYLLMSGINAFLNETNKNVSIKDSHGTYHKFLKDKS